MGPSLSRWTGCNTSRYWNVNPRCLTSPLRCSSPVEELYNIAGMKFHDETGNHRGGNEISLAVVSHL